jgi:hypothetical protein
MHAAMTNKGVSVQRNFEETKPKQLSSGLDMSSSITTTEKTHDNGKKTYPAMSPLANLWDRWKSHPAMSLLTNLWDHWKSRDDFCRAQMQVAGILVLAWCGNNWPKSYPRDDNENAAMFWLMNAVITIAAVATMKHDPNGSSHGVQVLSRNQTEEWKGLMQWVFIMVSRLPLGLLLSRLCVSLTLQWTTHSHTFQQTVFAVPVSLLPCAFRIQ